MADEIGLFEAIYNMRAMRRLKPDPVPDELIRKIIDAGLRAPTGGDSQNWRFIVVKDPENPSCL
jgi:nitroreductase